MFSLRDYAEKILKIKKEWNNVIPGVVISNNISNNSSSEEFLQNVAISVNFYQEFDIFEVNTDSKESIFLDKSIVTAIKSVQRYKLSKSNKRKSLFDRFSPLLQSKSKRSSFEFMLKH